MKFESYFSSSKANLYCVTAANGKRLLIECGCTWKKLEKALDYKLENVVGCLLTHEHADHSKAVENVLENSIDIYSSAGTFKALGVEHRRAIAIEELKGICIADTFYVFPFDVIHDAARPYGFVVQEQEALESLLFVADTSHIIQRFALEFNIIAICCNYDGEVLKQREASGDIDTEFAKRLLTSHMEKKVTLRYLKEFCNLSKCREIHLLHTSMNNIEVENVRKEFQDELSVNVYVAGGCSHF